MQLTLYTNESVRINEYPQCLNISHLFDNYSGEILLTRFNPSEFNRHKGKIQIRKKDDQYCLFMIEYGQEELHWLSSDELEWWKDSEIIMEF